MRESSARNFSTLSICDNKFFFISLSLKAEEETMKVMSVHQVMKFTHVTVHFIHFLYIVEPC